jgi:hypothetical protein
MRACAELSEGLRCCRPLKLFVTTTLQAFPNTARRANGTMPDAVHRSGCNCNTRWEASYSAQTCTSWLQQHWWQTIAASILYG